MKSFNKDYILKMAKPNTYGIRNNFSVGKYDLTYDEKMQCYKVIKWIFEALRYRMNNKISPESLLTGKLFYSYDFLENDIENEFIDLLKNIYIPENENIEYEQEDVFDCYKLTHQVIDALFKYCLDNINRNDISNLGKKIREISAHGLSMLIVERKLTEKDSKEKIYLLFKKILLSHLGKDYSSFINKNPIYPLFNLTAEEKEICEKEINFIVDLHIIAITEGILALGEVVKNTSSILKKYIDCIIEGVHFVYVYEIFNNYIYSKSFEDYELLLNVIRIKGVEIIAKGQYDFSELLSYIYETDILTEKTLALEKKISKVKKIHRLDL